MKEQKFLGQRRIFRDGGEMAGVFLDLSRKDEEASVVLSRNEYYNQAVYMLIQSMEKYIKYMICKRIDISKDFFADKLKDDAHNFDKSIDFLIMIMAGDNKVFAESLKKQFKEQILQGQKFSVIYNAVRYPFSNKQYKNYSFIEMDRRDYEKIENIFGVLKKALCELEEKKLY